MLDDIHSQAAQTKEWWDAKTVLRLLGPQSDSSVPQTDGGAQAAHLWTLPLRELQDAITALRVLEVSAVWVDLLLTLDCWASLR